MWNVLCYSRDLQPNTIDLSARLWGINPTNSVFIPKSLLMRSIVWDWILIYWNWSINFQALSTLIRFQTKTELLCSVFKKICVHTYRFRIVFALPRYNANQERSHTVASVRHFGYSGSSGLAPGGVYFDDVFSVHTRKQRFQKASFPNRSTLESVFEWLRFQRSFSAL